MISDRQLFQQLLGQTSNFPLMMEIERAEGVYMFDKNGKKFLDLISGISVSHLGHRHPEVLKAIHNQVDNYLHLMVYGEYIQTPQVRLAELLAENLPEELNCTYFVNSGSEAVEGALKLAKRYTGRFEVVSFHNAYHGSTHGALSVGGNEVLKNSFRPLLPGVTILPYNDQDKLVSITEKTACVIVETIQAEAGIIEPKPEFLKGLRQRCTEMGALLIFDEIQTGVGRTGKLFAFQHYNVVPDILLLAKGFGGGMPLGAFISSREIMSVLKTNPVLGHITTFGGHPVSCVAALASLKVILYQNLLASVSEKGQLFMKLLIHKNIRKIRGLGLFLAVDMGDPEMNKKVIQNCMDRGVITGDYLFCQDSFCIAPPLIISENEIKEACSLILDAIESVGMK